MDAKWIIATILIPVVGAVVGVVTLVLSKIFRNIEIREADLAKRVTNLEQRLEVIYERVGHQTELYKAQSEQLKTINGINTKIIERIDARKDSLDTLNETISNFIKELIKK